MDDPDRLRAQPVGRYAVGRSFLVWCASPTLTGTVAWGRVDGADLATLMSWWTLEARLADGFDAVIDVTRMDGIDPGVFQAAIGYVAGLARREPRMRRQAIVHGTGFAGAVVAGFYATQYVPYQWAGFVTAAAAFAWLSHDDGTYQAIDAMIGRETGVDPTLRALRGWLGGCVRAPSIERAALALTTSARSLQRRLRELGTSFRQEVQRARIEAARSRLVGSDDKIEAIAREVGFSSSSHLARAFLSATGETPAEYRARNRLPIHAG